MSRLRAELDDLLRHAFWLIVLGTVFALISSGWWGSDALRCHAAYDHLGEGAIYGPVAGCQVIAPGGRRIPAEAWRHAP